MNKGKIINTALLFATAIIWGFAFVAQVDGADHLGAFSFNALRFCIGVLSLAPVVLVFERGRRPRSEQKKTVLASILAGSVLFAASTLQQLGIGMTKSAGVAGFITGLYMVLVPIACLVIFRKKTGLNVWIGAICGFIGLFLLCFKTGEGFSFGIGELLLLIGSLFWTAHVIIIDKFSKELRPLHLSWGQFLVCALLGVIAMLIFERPSLDGIWNARMPLLYCGVLSVGVAYTLQVVAQKRADPTFAVIVLSTESVFSAVGGAIFGVDKISVLGYVGCAVMFAGIVISQTELKGRGRHNSSN